MRHPYREWDSKQRVLMPRVQLQVGCLLPVASLLCLIIFRLLVR